MDQPVPMASIRTRMASMFPALLPLWRRMKNIDLLLKPADAVFTDIYRGNKWNGKESRSGKGASLLYTERVRQVLPMWIEQLGIKSMLDIPCGDFFWMKEIDLSGIQYIGADIVHEMIDRNDKNFSNEQRRFLEMDLLSSQLPRVDLVFCRDCLVHMSNRDVKRALANIRASGSTYLATTSFPITQRNTDIPTGSWRPLNLTIPPFRFPDPLLVIIDTPLADDPLDGYWDKWLALWKIDDLR